MKNNWLVLVVLVILAGAAYMYSAYRTPTNQTATYPTPSETVVSLVMTKTNTTKGDYLVGPTGMTLYIFDKDAPGISNCNDKCATLWPPFMTTVAPATITTDMTTVKRADGTMMYAYKGMPIYYYTPDKYPGDVTGDGVGGVWHLVKP